MTLPPVSRASTGFVTRQGLPVEVEALPWARSFAAALVVGCGSRDDPADREGAAHLVEHLLCVADPVNATGGVPIFAVTEIDRTVYQAVGDPADAAPLVRRLLDIAAGASGRWGQDVFEGERQSVVLETRRMDHRPMLRLGPLLAAAAADEPGLDAIGRTTSDTIGRITERDVTDLLTGEYVPANARLFIAGPPAVADQVRVITDHWDVPQADVKAFRQTEYRVHEAATPMHLHGMEDLAAVTLLRPRAERSLAYDAVLEPSGPILGLGTAEPLLPNGRTGIAGRTQRVDVLMWRNTDACAPLARRLGQFEADDWRALVRKPLERLSVKHFREREWRGATPAGRVGDAAERVLFDGEPRPSTALALWIVTGGKAELVARQELVAVQEDLPGR